MEQRIKKFMDNIPKKESRLDFSIGDPIIENSSDMAKRIKGLIGEIEKFVKCGVIRVKFPYIDITYHKVMFGTKMEVKIYWSHPEEYQSVYKTQEFYNDLKKAIDQCNSIKILARSRGVTVEDEGDYVTGCEQNKWDGILVTKRNPVMSFLTGGL